MKYRIHVLEEVVSEISEVYTYYENQRQGLGLILLDEWEKTVGDIAESPLGYQKKYKNFRLAILGRFPYVVVFEVEKSDIVIYRFISAKRHPAKRYGKKKGT